MIWFDQAKGFSCGSLIAPIDAKKRQPHQVHFEHFFTSNVAQIFGFMSQIQT